MSVTRVLEDKAPEPMAAVIDSFRTARFVELWRLAEIATPEALGPYRDRLSYRGRLIAGFDRRHAVSSSTEVLNALLAALACGRPNVDLAFWRADSNPTLQEVLKEFRFAPDFVITFSGSAPLRVEVQFSTRSALIQTADKWGLIELERTDAETLQALSDGLGINPAVSPNVAFPGTRSY